MQAYLISFVSVDETNRHLVFQLVDSFSDWAKINESTWIVLSAKTNTDIRDLLSTSMNTWQEDAQKTPFIVMNVSNCGWASHALDREITSWMKKKMRI